MRDLRAHRQGWDVAESARAPQETLTEFRQLFEEFAPLLEKTEAVFRPEREAYLTQLQERLRRLAHCQKNRQ